LLNVYLQLSALRSRGGFYERAEHFQWHITEIICGDRPKVKLLPLPEVKDDETTLRSTSGVVVKFLLLSGLVLYEKGRYKLAKDIRKWHLIMFGDCLSCERFRNCQDRLIKKQGRFTTHYEDVTVFLTALDKVYMLPSNPHGGRFHTLGPVYSLFYGGFLQPIQITLGYKWINNKKVEKTFQQASVFVLQILHQAEQAMYDAFLFELEWDKLPEILENIDDPEVLATFLADKVAIWMKMKLATSTDEMFRFGLNFINMTWGFRFFGCAIPFGSFIIIEHLWINFCLIWKLMGKKIYIEITLSQIEDL
jgi:hypothetical protein